MVYTWVNNIACVSFTIIIVSVFSLGHQLYQLKSLKSPEREELLASHDQERYLKAFKETLSLVMYPFTVLFLLIIDMLGLINLCSETARILGYISNVLSGCIGGISAGIFFLQQLCVRIQFLPKRPPGELSGNSNSVNIRTSNTGYGSTYYTAEDHLEENT